MTFWLQMERTEIAQQQFVSTIKFRMYSKYQEQSVEWQGYNVSEAISLQTVLDQLMAFKTSRFIPEVSG